MRILRKWVTLALVVSLSGLGSVPASAERVDATDRASDVWSPAPKTTWQWQIVGRVRAPYRQVTMYDVDLQDAVPRRTKIHVPGFGTVIWPRGVNAHAVAGLHAAGTDRRVLPRLWSLRRATAPTHTCSPTGSWEPAPAGGENDGSTSDLGHARASRRSSGVGCGSRIGSGATESSRTRTIHGATTQDFRSPSTTSAAGT